MEYLIVPITWRAWTTGEIKKAETLRLDGYTIKEISVIVNHPYHGVRTCLTRRGIYRMCKRKSQYMELFNTGRSNKEIAIILQVKPRTVMSTRARLRKDGVDQILPQDTMLGADHASRRRTDVTTHEGLQSSIRGNQSGSNRGKGKQ